MREKKRDASAASSRATFLELNFRTPVAMLAAPEPARRGRLILERYTPPLLRRVWERRHTFV